MTSEPQSIGAKVDLGWKDKKLVDSFKRTAAKARSREKRLESLSFELRHIGDYRDLTPYETHEYEKVSEELDALRAGTQETKKAGPKKKGFFGRLFEMPKKKRKKHHKKAHHKKHHAHHSPAHHKKRKRHKKKATGISLSDIHTDHLLRKHRVKK
jgi:hypothetical protein